MRQEEGHSRLSIDNNKKNNGQPLALQHIIRQEEGHSRPSIDRQNNKTNINLSDTAYVRRKGIAACRPTKKQNKTSTCCYRQSLRCLFFGMRSGLGVGGVGVGAQGGGGEGGGVARNAHRRAENNEDRLKRRRHSVTQTLTRDTGLHRQTQTNTHTYTLTHRQTPTPTDRHQSTNNRETRHPHPYTNKVTLTPSLFFPGVHVCPRRGAMI